MDKFKDKVFMLFIVFSLAALLFNAPFELWLISFMAFVFYEAFYT